MRITGESLCLIGLWGVILPDTWKHAGFAEQLPHAHGTPATTTDGAATDPAAPDQHPADEGPVTTGSLQEQPALVPSPEFQPQTPLPTTASQLASQLFGQVGQSLLARQGRPGAGAPGAEVVFGSEAKARITTDVGSLLGKSPSILGMGIQRRTPIVTDPRIRGSRVGQLAASGSYWVPAHIDLDTVLSKIDSRIVDDVLVINGPYSTRYGPGFNFVDVTLLHSPRFEHGFQSHGSTSVDYQVNGQQWYGRESVWGGTDEWGFRAGYGHRTGNDYVSGNGTDVPSSYKSRDFDVALGLDLTPDSSLEFNALRLDQTDVEYPGQAFDIDYLVTDGYELEYVLENQSYFDRFVVNTWYNRTRFDGNAQQPGKRRQFPFYDFINYEGFTDVDSTSTGFSTAATWGEEGCPQLTAGVDLRHVKQELNEIASGRFGLNIFQDANSPIPKSRWQNPGLFVEHVNPVGERLEIVCGARIDWVTTNVIDDPNKLSALGLQQPQSSLSNILGTDEWAQSFTPWSAFLTGRYRLNDRWTTIASAGRTTTIWFLLIRRVTISTTVSTRSSSRPARSSTPAATWPW